MSSNNINILHLTDIHCGSGEYTDIDGKVSIPRAEIEKQLDRLTLYLQDLVRAPDFVVISGDISIRGQEDGFEIFRKWLLQRIDEGVLPQAEYIMIVPGNHDVTRQRRLDSGESDRFTKFWNAFGKTFPHAIIPDHDPIPPSEVDIVSSGNELSGGITVTEQNGDIFLDRSVPFILDLQKDTLIFGFNSAHGCGVPLPPNDDIIGPLNSIINITSNEDQKQALVKSKEAYLDSLIIDAGMLTAKQISYFNAAVRSIRNQLGERYESLTKIAVLHHHIGHLWDQQIELKQFESTVDASQLKQSLTEHDFDVVLHGHKHTNHVGLDGSLIPIDRSERFNPLCVVSGGTVGGYPRTGDQQSFKLIELEGRKGPRRAAIIREIPLRETSNPASAMKNESKIYHVAFANRMLHLHDFSSVKERFDEELLGLAAPEIFDDSGTHAKSATLTPSAPKLFSNMKKYRCHSYLSNGKSTIFFEVIQLTRRLRFRDFARIHWLVSDARATHKADKTAKLVILIGTLEDTHFSEATEQGEILESIEELETFLRPAITSGLVDIRTHDFNRKDAIRLSQVQ